MRPPPLSLDWEIYNFLAVAAGRQLLITSVFCLLIILGLTYLWRHSSPRLLLSIWMLMLLPLLVPLYSVFTASPLVRVPASWNYWLASHAAWLIDHPCATPFYDRVGRALSARLPGLTWYAVLVAAWCLGAAFELACFIRTRRRFNAVVRRALPLQRDDVLRSAETWRRRYGIRRAVRLRHSAEFSHVFTIGTLRPVVYLPTLTVERLSVEEIDAVLGHELAHVRRFDDLGIGLFGICQALFFFTPLTWVAGRAIAGLREQCCDAMTIRAGRLPPRLYLLSLLKVIELQGSRPVPKGLMMFSPKASSLRQRVAKVLAVPARRSRGRFALALAAVLGAIVLTGPQGSSGTLDEARTRALFGELRLLSPLPDGTLSRAFGGGMLFCSLHSYPDSPHAGIDLRFGADDRVLAALDGRVVQVLDDYAGEIGYSVSVQSASGIVADYRHVGEPTVRPGDQVRAGQQIAVRDHSLAYDYLHFELSYRGLVLNPAVLDPAWQLATAAAPAGNGDLLAPVHRVHGH